MLEQTPIHTYRCAYDRVVQVLYLATLWLYLENGTQAPLHVCWFRSGATPMASLCTPGCWAAHEAGQHAIALMLLRRHAQVKDPTARVEHEASTSKIGEDQLFYFQQRGIDAEEAVATIISGFCADVFNKLPDEFAEEVNALMSLKLEGSVG